ncbi:hypothetical protein YC2023_122829 [Brassica napus]
MASFESAPSFDGITPLKPLLDRSKTIHIINYSSTELRFFSVKIIPLICYKLDFCKELKKVTGAHHHLLAETYVNREETLCTLESLRSRNCWKSLKLRENLLM